MTIRINSLLANSLIIRLPKEDLKGVDVYLLDKNLNLKIFLEAKDSSHYKTFRILRRSNYSFDVNNQIYDYKDLIPYRRVYYPNLNMSQILPGFSFREGWARLLNNENGSQIEKKFY